MSLPAAGIRVHQPTAILAENLLGARREPAPLLSGRAFYSADEVEPI